MKKIFGTIIILTFIFSLTGCGSKTVSCTKQDDSQIQEISAVFKNNIVNKVITTAKMTVEENQVETAYKYMQSMISSYNSKEGISASVIKEKNAVGMKLEMDLSKMSEENLGSMSITAENLKNATSESFIESMTEEGYACK